MKQRTKRLPTSKGVVYIVLALLLAGGKHIYNNYIAPEGEQELTTVINTEPTSPKSEDKITLDNESKPQKSKDKRKVNRSGWAELPAERRSDDLYYAYHTVAEEDKSDPRRNYAVCFSREQRCPVWVAAALHPSFKGDTPRSNSYQPDPQLPLNIQPLLSRSYGGEYTRGHMLGSAERTSTRACNDQTFYASNIAPQLREGFNTGGGAWNNLENYVRRQVCQDTLYTVVGCIFTEYTDCDGEVIEPITTPNRNDTYRVGVPTAYYYALLRTRDGDTGKSVRECSERELKCAALVVGHRSAHKRKPSAKELISIEELERLTGEKFFINVPNAPKKQARASDWNVR